MGQKDPLTEWQREGFEMFGAMMKGIAQDFVKYVMHVQVVRKDAPQQTVQNVQQSSSDDAPAGGIAAAARAAGLDPATAAATHRQVSQRMPGQAVAPAKPVQKTVVKDEWSKTSRNAPCPCGSGKKFKVCHGTTTA